MTPPPLRARAAPLFPPFIRTAPAPRTARWVSAGALAGVTALAAALRLGGLDAQGFSVSEAAYVAAAEGERSAAGLLVRAAVAAFGAGDAALRAPSAIAGIAAVPLLYAAARQVAGRQVSLGCAALLAIAPLHVAVSQDARPYSLAVLAALAASLAALRALGSARLARIADAAAELHRRRRALVVAACAALVPVAAAALAAAAWRPVKPDFRRAVAEVEARVEPEDLLVFDAARTEVAYLHYARRADDRLVPGERGGESLAAAAEGRARTWLVLSDVRRERAMRRALPGWREADRVTARGVAAVLLERAGPAHAAQARRPPGRK